MSPEIRAIVLLFHLVAMLFMAAPLYMLVIVNERARFAVPPGYNTDRYMENIIKGQPNRCYAYLTVILITGVLLWWARGWGLDWALVTKLAAFVLLVGLLSYVHLGIQPQIERVLEGAKPGEEVSADKKPVLAAWRKRRKRLSATCLFLVLTALIMGIRLTWGFAVWLAVPLVIIAALFAWRAYRAPVRLGWF